MCLRRSCFLRLLSRTWAPLGGYTGKVASWMPGRGFGFVQDAKSNEEHFVHYSAIKVEPEGAFRALTVGQDVEFDIVTQDGRTRAENVTAVGAALPGGPRPGQVKARRTSQCAQF